MTTQTHPIIVERGGTVEARADALGLAALLGPKDQAIGNSARSETLAERPAFLFRKGKPAAISGSGPGSKLGGGITA